MLTVEDVRNWRFRLPDHYNGGREWFGYGGSAPQNPRLYVIEKSFKKTRTTVQEWSVDGVKMPSIEAAVEALNQPVQVTDGELRTIAAMPDDWASKDQVSQMLGVDRSTLWTILLGLRRKGLVDVHDGTYRRSALAREVLAR